MKKTLILPIPARRALRKLGADINAARRRRRIPTAVMAERASMSPVTLNKIEKGDPGVSIGNVAKVLFVLGMTERLSDLADLRNDKIGLVLEHESLPKRIRAPKQPKQPKQPGPDGDK
ncbi:MAG: XRE family transcriptional regulator [Rhodospirillales bacterium]